MTRPHTDQVPPGYKKTEVGVIPEEWEVKELGCAGSFSKGRGIRKDQADSGEIPCVRYGELYTHHNDIIRSFKSFIARDVAKTSVRIMQGDILFACSGETKHEIGKCAAFIDNDEVYAGSDIIIVRPDSINSVFLGYLLNAPFVACQKASKGQGDAVVHISISSLAMILIPVPPPAEQCAIAVALSDVDDLIEELERLIEKKRAVKKAAMQKLLTGQTRLPGFDGEWEEKRLGDVASLKARIGWQGLTTAEYLNNGDYLLVTGTEFSDGQIDWESCYYVSEDRYRQDENIQLQQNDVLITKDGTIGKVALISEVDKPATLNSGIFVVRPLSASFHPQFFYHIMCSRVFIEFLSQLSAGSTINHLYQKDFVEFTFSMPINLDEQTAIAEVLSDMDAEIEALEARLAKTREIKRGMMQELLTGRTRLV